MITRLQEKCPTCKKIAVEKSRMNSANHSVIFLTCGHVVLIEKEVRQDYASITFDGDLSCTHKWNGTICIKCQAKKLYPYQIAGAEFVESANGRAAIFDEMGLGKTIQALAYLKLHPEAFPYLWVTKSGIKYQHAKEITRVLGAKNFPLIIRSSKDHFIPGVAGYVVGYDLFRNLSPEKFEKLNIQSVILDECQAIKNSDSQRTQSIRRIIKNVPRIIPLSGTPWKNRGSEFFTVLNLLDAYKFGNYQRFKDSWVDEYWDGNRLKEGGIRNPDKFKEYIKDIAIRRERKEVMPELPSISRLKLTVEVPEHARKVYAQEQNALTKVYNDAVLSGEEDSLDTYRQMMTHLIIMRQIVGLAKMPSTIEWLQEFIEDTDRKVVCFVHHKKCGEEIFRELSTWCADNGYFAPLQITSEMSSQERFETQELFNGPSHRLLIASTLASGEGLNLQSCSDCIIHERQWNPANEMQAEGRFIRIGQKASAVTATYVHGDDTIDTVLDDLVERKRQAFDNAMNKDGYIGNWEADERSLIKELVSSIARSK